jgi:hypothetical protein
MSEPRAPLRLDQEQLQLESCPHCRRHLPTLEVVAGPIFTSALDAPQPRAWKVYACRACGGIVVAWAWHRAPVSNHPLGKIEGILPQPDELSATIPDTARKYLHQAQESLHAPDGAVMLAASAVDAMLKTKDYVEGSLYSRIKLAADNHLITPDMALWAHHVRLEANNPRHVDDEEPHATPESAKQAVEFAAALANILFVLPSRVTRGLKEAGGTPVDEGGELPES